MNNRFRIYIMGCMMASMFFFIIGSVNSYACTSVIISGKVTASGRPLMMKHRDTGQLNNRIEWFHGQVFDFVALVNSDWRTNPSSKRGFRGEAWSGTNAAGFSIMNTATYDLKDDNVPDDMMDGEGVLMYRALEICATLNDFEHMLDTLARPMQVEANFGVIDAAGGAAYYEVNNSKWVKFDVNDTQISPQGYRVVTNFTQTGRVADRKGVERYEKASVIMSNVFDGVSFQNGKFLPKIYLDHQDLINLISRSGSPILRKLTSAVIIFEGVRPGENPRHTVMWTALGYPIATPCIPVMVLDRDRVPAYLKSSSTSDNAIICSNALEIKEKLLTDGISNQEDIVSACKVTESMISKRFNSIYERWTEGKISDNRFEELYDKSVAKFYSVYQSNFSKYLK